MQRVKSPDGREWSVGRRWLPERHPHPRLRSSNLDLSGDVLSGLAVDDGLLIGLAIGVVLVIATVALIVLMPFLVVLAEVLLVVLLTLVAVFGRVFLGKPWHVRATTKGPPAAERVWKVQGWSASGAKVDEVAGQLAAGLEH
jgi:hypothetical protein